MLRGIGLLVCLVGLSGCFDAILDTAGATDVTTTTTTTTMTGNDSDTGTSTTGAGSDTATDGDISGAETSTTTTGGTSEGLLCGGVMSVCDLWQVDPCEDPCGTPDPSGVCVLENLEARTMGAVTIRRCDPECRRTHIVFRPATDHVIVQTQLLGPKDEVKQMLPPELCALVAPSFFAACQEAFTAPCADPANWFSTCGPYVQDACPL